MSKIIIAWKILKFIRKNKATIEVLKKEIKDVLEAAKKVKLDGKEDAKELAKVNKELIEALQAVTPILEILQEEKSK